MMAWGAKLAQGCGLAATSMHGVSRHSRADTLARIVELQAARFPFEIKSRYHQPCKCLNHYGHEKRK
jgi:hypothetical protein